MEPKPVFGGTDLQEVSAAGEQPTVMFTIERRLMRADLNTPYHIILLMVVIRCTHTHTHNVSIHRQRTWASKPWALTKPLGHPDTASAEPPRHSGKTFVELVSKWTAGREGTVRDEWLLFTESKRPARSPKK